MSDSAEAVDRGFLEMPMRNETLEAAVNARPAAPVRNRRANAYGDCLRSALDTKERPEGEMGNRRGRGRGYVREDEDAGGLVPPDEGAPTPSSSDT